MADDLTALNGWLEPLLRRLEPANRKRLIVRIARGLRQRQAQRIGRQQNPDGSPFAPRKPRVRGKAGQVSRRAKMFAKLRTARHMLARHGPEGAAVGFAGRSARIAQVHQLGETDDVGPDGPLFRYPARRLLGWTAEDRQWVLDQVAAALRE